MNEQLKSAVSRVIDLLVIGNFSQLAWMTKGVRLNADEMAKALAAYGNKLVSPPQSAFELMDAIEVKNSEPRRWSITMPLWTIEEGRSDLSLEITAIERQNGIDIELDDIRVL